MERRIDKELDTGRDRQTQRKPVGHRERQTERDTDRRRDRQMYRKK